MNCSRCGDLMCPEMVIRLRRTLFGLRHSRCQGAYCASCKISIVLEEIDPPPTVRARAVRPVSGGWWHSLRVSSQHRRRNIQHQHRPVSDLREALPEGRLHISRPARCGARATNCSDYARSRSTV